MKRVFFLLILFLLVAAWIRVVRLERREEIRFNNDLAASHDLVLSRSPRWHAWGKGGADISFEGDDTDRRAIILETRQARAAALREARQALREAEQARAAALREAHRALQEADHDARRSLAEAAAEIHEAVSGLPVPVLAGTVVTEAQATPPGIVPEPPAPPAMPIPPALPALPAPPAPVEPPSHDAANLRVVTGRISATEDRAQDDARRQLETEVIAWLDRDVSETWKPPAPLLSGLIRESRTVPVEKDYGTLYVAEYKADFSPRMRDALIEAHDRELVWGRTVALGGSLAFVLVCLGAISGYIRADEATRGYYTRPLRLLAASAVGGAGVVLYRMFV
jgi:hypothetical protein